VILRAAQAPPPRSINGGVYSFGDISEKLNDACANCHKVYRDKGGAEGSGAVRCQ